ncbi:MAG: GNAT family N-acetyltransferase [Candidatus Omnitrophota bacterium]|nr:GNAT family N-acetyltransferase [Candidatus Omnitrophota bacterium]
MELKTRVTRKIEDIPREDWDSVYPNHLEGYNFFKSLDESKFEQFSFYYIMVYDGDTALGAAACFSMRYSLDTSISGPIRRAFNFIKKGFPDFLSVKALACGSPMDRGSIGMAGRDKTIVAAILKKMEEIAEHEKAPLVAFKDFPHSYSGVFSILTDNGFFKIDSLPYAEMEVTFGSFDDYLDKLSGASRYDLRRKFRKVDGAVKIDMEIVAAPDDDTLADIYSLYIQMLDKHEMTFEIAPKDFFNSVVKNMPKEAKFFLWRIEGKLAAFLFALTSGDVFIDYYLGLDYEVAYKYHLFFIKFRDCLKWCIENKIRRYEIGFSGYEPKKRLGFDFTPLHIYARHRNRFMNPLFKILVHFLKFENFDPDLKKINLDRGTGEKRPSDIKSIRADNLKRLARQRSPVVHEEGARRDRD